MGLNIDDPSHLQGATVIGDDGQKLGNVDGVYYDNATDRPEWVAVRSGLFGTRVTLVPLRRADDTGHELHVPFDRIQLKNAPHHDPGRELSSSAEADLYRYYGLDYADADDSVETDEFAIDLDDPPAPEDGLPAGPARLRKVVVTEHQDMTVEPERDVPDHRYL
jgi:sporulation protein YlmC with PRC-barrel domain